MTGLTDALPERQAAALRRAIHLEWATLAFLAVAITLVGIVMGGSQAMRAAWVEDLLSLAPPLAFLIAVRVGAPLPVVIALLLPVPFASGASNANITAITLAPYPRMAGTASAFLGACQFGVAALVPPLVSLLGVGALVMGVTLVVTAAATCLVSLSPMLHRRVVGRAIA